jgi:hypothetical protein
MTGATFTIEEALLDQLRGLREPMDRIDRALRDDGDEVRTALRELRGELAQIRTRLDSLVPIEKQLGWQGQRLTAVEKRLTTLVETRLVLSPVEACPEPGRRACPEPGRRGLDTGSAAKGRSESVEP